uniref:Uncharacterized protein n=1 Tax=Nelumbo nucifera TaxID=4432 RepID=A0A822Z7J0_NELNU|nr:TPA_asm: hypothetical protein HUJ06_008109 [Nelumbo nucifera]
MCSVPWRWSSISPFVEMGSRAEGTETTIATSLTCSGNGWNEVGGGEEEGRERDKEVRVETERFWDK